jgi:hypothetical protein
MSKAVVDEAFVVDLATRLADAWPGRFVVKMVGGRKGVLDGAYFQDHLGFSRAVFTRRGSVAKPLGIQICKVESYAFGHGTMLYAGCGSSIYDKLLQELGEALKAWELRAKRDREHSDRLTAITKRQVKERLDKLQVHVRPASVGYTVTVNVANVDDLEALLALVQVQRDIQATRRVTP